MTPREKEPEVTGFARKVADAITGILETRGISGRELSRRIGRSNNYIAMRLRKEASFTLTDIESIGEALGFDAGTFLGTISVSNVTPFRQAKTIEDLDILDAETEAPIRNNGIAANVGEIESEQ